MQPFKQVRSLMPGRSVFNLSYEKKFTCDMGELYPVMCEEAVPGDKWTIGNQMILRFQPLVAPILHEVNVYVHYFFVPYRLLWSDWENFITGGVTGNYVATPPTWPSNAQPTVGTLWDALGLPLVKPTTPASSPVDFPRLAYYKIYDEYYRDETFQPALFGAGLNVLVTRAWEKDYFTSSLPWQQRGTAPALPVSGTTSAVWGSDLIPILTPKAAGGVGDTAVYNPANSTQLLPQSGVYIPNQRDLLIKQADINNNSVDMDGLTTFTVNDLRLAFQLQKWLERNARGGARYTEFLRSHFGLSPRDERLQRPEYIGGSKAPVIFSEVLQTSGTGATGQATPQGNMAGHGISVNQSHCAHYMTTEFGLIMGLMSVMPKPVYSQGINRQWLRKTKYDYPFPEFVNLSEQAIQNSELYVDGTAADDNIFGYQGRFDELRYKPSMITGKMRTTYAYWHLARIFSSRPALGASFITCIPRKDIFAVPSEPGLIVQFGNLIKAVRPIPALSEPGLIDHH